jgi:hypothetical protein
MLRRTHPRRGVAAVEFALVTMLFILPLLIGVWEVGRLVLVTYSDPFNPSDLNKVAWNAAALTERIAVPIKGTYRPVTPLSISAGRFTIALVSDNIPINVVAMMGNEG